MHAGDKAELNDQDPAVLWICSGIDDGEGGSEATKRMGYYLDFEIPYPADIDSTALRVDLLQTFGLTEQSLNRMSTEDLMKLIMPFL